MPSIYESFSIQNFSTKGPLTLNYHFLTDNPRKISLSAPFPDAANHVDFPPYYNICNLPKHLSYLHPTPIKIHGQDNRS